MTKLLKLAWRDVWRNRRRSLITMGAIVFAVLIITVTSSLQYGTFDAMEEMTVRLFSSDLQVHRAGFQEEKTLSYALEDAEQDWPALMQEQPWVTAYTRRLSGFGLVSSDSSSAGAMIVGIEPQAERGVTSFSQKIVEGLPLAEGDDHAALLGRTLAHNLDVGVGDTVVALTQGYHNAMGADLYAVRGLLGFGNADMDRTLMIMPLPDAQFLFSMDGRFTELVLRTDHFRRAGAYAEALRGSLGQDRYEVLPWKELMPELRQMRALKSASNNVFFFFLILLIGFEIFNTTTMSVMERVREFGVMQSIGMKPRQLSLLVTMELGLKVALALAVGLLITLGLVLWLEGHPIPLSAEMLELYDDFGFNVEGFTFSARAVVFVQPLVSVAVVSLAAMLYPVLKLRRFSPVEALRTG